MPADSIVFDRAAGYYDETRGFPPGIEKEVADLIRRVGSLTPSSHVLEVGVGTGRIALPLAPHLHGLYGIDLSRPMLNRLREKQTTERVYVTEGDITRLPFKSGSFDAAVAVHIFHLVPNWKGALQEVGRVLRPGTPLISGGTGETDTFKPLWDAWNKALPPHKRDVGVQQMRRNDFALEEGWRLGEEQLFIYEYSRIPQEIVELARRRVWSRLWDTTDEELAGPIAAMQEAIKTQFGDPNKPVQTQASFRVQTFYPPSS
jgi:ubiquinone/menaquinone biosynthesis C-methylase UbiE